MHINTTEEQSIFSNKNKKPFIISLLFRENIQKDITDKALPSCTYLVNKYMMVKTKQRKKSTAFCWRIFGSK